MRYSGYVISHVGNIRSNNEDNANLNGSYQDDTAVLAWECESVSENSIAAAVFDGMGGESNGDVAAKIAAEMFSEFVDSDLSQNIYAYVEEANRAIALYDISNSMGTTFAAYYGNDEQHFFYNIGDSRGYLYRDKNLQQMTRDHNPVRRMQAAGILTKEQAEKHPQRNAISQFLGMKEFDEVIVPECYTEENVPAAEGDIVLLCTDGLTELVSEEEICDVLSGNDTIEDKVKSLINLALEAGGKDNVTIVIIEILND